VDSEGRFTTFSPELLGQESAEYGPFVIGDFAVDDLASALGSPVYLAMVREVAAGVELCRQTCPYFGVCGGGAPANKYFENGSFATAETMYCRYVVQAPIDIVLEDFEAQSTIRSTSPSHS
jgi:uncharacterized protein